MVPHVEPFHLVVRAGVVSAPEESDWSSHRDYVGLQEPPAWLHGHDVLGGFGNTAEQAAERFTAFVNEGIDSPRYPELSGDALPEARRAAKSDVGEAWRVSYSILRDPPPEIPPRTAIPPQESFGESPR